MLIISVAGWFSVIMALSKLGIESVLTAFSNTLSVFISLKNRYFNSLIRNLFKVIKISRILLYLRESLL